MERKSRKYTNEYKLDCLNYYDLNYPNLNLSEICSNLGIPIGTFSGWLKKRRKENISKIPTNSNDLRSELFKLRLELDKIKKERGILKKTLLIFMNDNN